MEGVEVKPSPEGVPGAVTDPRRIAAEEVTFAGAGGEQVNGYLARPAEEGSHPAMIVIHEAGGLGDHIRDVGNRFANIGYVALGVDLYTREGGPPPMDDVQAMMERLFSMPDATVLGDLEGAADFLRARDGRERAGRLHRLLHGRALHAAVRLRERPRWTPPSTAGAASSTGDARRALDARAPDAAARARRAGCAARCWPRSAPRTRTPRPSSASSCASARARQRPARSRSTSTRAPATRSSPTTARPTGPRPAAKLWERDRAVPRAPPAGRLSARRRRRGARSPCAGPAPTGSGAAVHIVRARHGAQASGGAVLWSASGGR